METVGGEEEHNDVAHTVAYFNGRVLSTMLHHNFFVATSIGIGLAGFQHVGALGVLSGAASVMYWLEPVEHGHFQTPRLLVDFFACVTMCAAIVLRGLVRRRECRVWTGLAALFCAASYACTFADDGWSSSRQRACHFAMHVCAIGALANLG